MLRSTCFFSVCRLKKASATVLAFTLFSCAASATLAETPPQFDNCQRFLQQSGLEDVIAQIPHWLDAEMLASQSFLAAHPSLNDQIKARLTAALITHIHTRLCNKIIEKIGDANVELAGKLMASPPLFELARLRQLAFQDDEPLVEYEKKMRGAAPIENRQEWIRKLDQNSGVSNFKTAIWIELRKTVLWSVGKANGKTFNEADLDRELISFQRESVERAQRETSAQWLFAYRRVPDDVFQLFFNNLDSAAAQKTAVATLAAIKTIGNELRAH